MDRMDDFTSQKENKEKFEGGQIGFDKEERKNILIF